MQPEVYNRKAKKMQLIFTRDILDVFHFLSICAGYDSGQDALRKHIETIVRNGKEQCKGTAWEHLHYDAVTQLNQIKIQPKKLKKYRQKKVNNITA